MLPEPVSFSAVHVSHFCSQRPNDVVFSQCEIQMCPMWMCFCVRLCVGTSKRKSESICCAQLEYDFSHLKNIEIEKIEIMMW